MDMRVNFSSYNFTFKSNPIPKMPPEGIEMGIDGYEEGNAWRRAVMDDYYALAEYSKYYEPPKSEEEMNRMLKSWGLGVDKFTEEIIIPPDLNAKPLGNNNYRGALVSDFNFFQKLKESGIKTIISAIKSAEYKIIAKNVGMQYIELTSKNNLDDSYSYYIFGDIAFYDEEDYMFNHKKTYEYYRENCKKSGHEKDIESQIEKSLEYDRNYFRTKNREFIDTLTEAVRAWQKGCCFIGCNFGVTMTSKSLDIIDVFNPGGDSSVVKKIDKFDKNRIATLYKRLTPEDKSLMGWTKEFENLFIKRFVNVK